MSEAILALSLLGTLGLALLALNVGAWLAPRTVSGSLPMRVGSILCDVSLIWLFATPFLLRASYSGSRFSGEEPALRFDVFLGIGFAALAVGLIAFVAGYYQSRQARPAIPVDAVRPGPPSR